MGKQLRAGNVVTIRVNPKDCMGVVDVIQKAGIYTPGMSFAQMVSICLSSVLQTLRDSEVIPERDGFEYLNVVGPYISKQSGKKIEVTKTINQLGSKIAVRGLSQPIKQVPELEESPLPAAAYVEPVMTMEQKRAGALLKELDAKRELAEDNPNVIWQHSDQVEWDRLYKIVYPEG